MPHGAHNNGMKTPELQEFLQREDVNVSAFSKRYGLPLRTLMRIKKDGAATRANALMIAHAMNVELQRKENK